jgi:hypothetical protein
MTERDKSTRTGGHRQETINRLKDEVYRQMFRLEAKRPGSEMDLAIALLRAWTAAEAESRDDEGRNWLKQICPICLLMIEATRQSHKAEQQCIQ